MGRRGPKDSHRPRQQLGSVKDWSAQKKKIGSRRFTNELADELRDEYYKEGYYESLNATDRLGSVLGSVAGLSS